MKFLTLSLLLCFSQPGSAAVNMLNGSYYNDVALIALSDGSSLVVRYVHSNEDTGLFGLGWCSEVEHRLLVNKDKALFTYCGTGAQEELQLSMQTDLFPRVEKSNDLLVLKKSPFSELSFNSEGRLVRIQDEKRSWKLEWHKAHMLLHTAKRDLVRFQMKANKVEAVQGPGNQFSFQYEGDLLTTIQAGKSIHRSFSYDKRKRMAKVTGTNLTNKIEYRPDNLVRSLQAQGCSEDLDYNLTSSSSFEVVVNRSCGNKKAPPKKLQVQQNGDELIARDAVGQSSVLTQVMHFPSLRPLAVRTKGKAFEFSKNGQLSHFEDKLKSIDFKYNKAGYLIKKSVSDYYGTTNYKLNYDNQHQVKSVSDGKSVVRLKHSALGHLLAAEHSNLRLTTEGNAVRVLKKTKGKWVQPKSLSSKDLSTYSNLRLGVKMAGDAKRVYGIETQ